MVYLCVIFKRFNANQLYAIVFYNQGVFTMYGLTCGWQVYDATKYY